MSVGGGSLSRRPAARARALLHRLPAPEDGPDAARLLPERAALRSAWVRALAAGEGTVGALARSLDLVLLRTGPEDEHLHLLGATLASPALPAAERRPLLLSLARLHALRGRHRAAIAAVEQARREGEPTATSAVLMAFCLRALGRLAEARAEAERGLACPELERQAAAEVALGVVALSEERWVEAATALGRASAWARLVEAPRIEGIAEANLALAALGVGEAEAAKAAVGRARACLLAAGDRFHLARLQHIEGERLRRAGDLDAAEAHLLAAAAEAEADGDVDFGLAAREGLVEVALARRDARAAAARLEGLQRRAEGVEDPRWPGRLAALRARLAALGEGARALRLDPEARRVSLDGVPLDFSRRGPVRRVLLALVGARGRGLGVGELLAAGWPGERMSPRSGEARVYMAVRRLRDLGLNGVLLTRDDGYRLAPDCRVEVVGCEAM